VKKLSKKCVKKIKIYILCPVHFLTVLDTNVRGGKGVNCYGMLANFDLSIVTYGFSLSFGNNFFRLPLVFR
jgi:hypothetical protein